MKCTVSWLQQFTSTEGFTAAQLADRLTMLGLEVDGVEELYPSLEAIITARVETVERHPGADKLMLCQVNTGSEHIQVVCGAQNVHAGMVTALALPGVVLPDGTKLKKSKIRGVESCGMLCSARELGLPEEHSGIMELDERLAPGLSLRQALKLNDAIIDIDLTPNRADCASVMGLAREISSFTGGALKPLVSQVRALDAQQAGFSVRIENPLLCKRYAACRLSAFHIAPSPVWMQRQLLAAGMRPINNIVDITNYVMLESGQPLHAFDFACLEDQAIVVRPARADEKELVTLDGVTRTLTPDTLLICDSRKPLALAGVMGGQESEITEKTQEILLESACFDPVSIRRTARRLGLPSEASYRFERGVDPELAPKALTRAVELLMELAGAKATPGGHDVYPGEKEALKVPLRMSRVAKLLGRDFSESEALRPLERIGFTFKETAPGEYEALVPSFRMDIEREEDLVEEVARLTGYDSIPVSQPLVRLDAPTEDRMRTLRREIAHNLAAQGFYESINYSFTSSEHPDKLSLAVHAPERNRVRLLNPISEELAALRSLLLPGLLENVARNHSFQRTDLRLFEIGKVFFARGQNEQPEERMHLAAVLSGSRYPGAEPLYFAGRQSEFADIKGALCCLLNQLGLSCGPAATLDFDTREPPPYAMSGQCLRLHAGGKTLGHVGVLQHKVVQAFDLRLAVYFFELDLEALLELPRKIKQFTALSRYPATSRDISLIVPKTCSAGDLLAAVQAQQQKCVEQIQLFDIYTGAPLAEDEKSVSLSITYRSLQTTLDDATVEKTHKKIVQALMKQFNARYREATNV